MNVLPPAIIAARSTARSVTTLPTTTPLHILGGTAPPPPPKMAFLPPAILSARPLGVPPPTPDRIELVSDDPAPRKKGRPSKKEKMREARAAASASIAALLDSKPNKAAIREYFIGRISELSDI